MRSRLPRRALIGGAAAALAAGAPSGRAATHWRDRSRLLWVRNQAGEEIAGAFRRPDATPDYRVVARLQHLFRDLHVGAPGPLPLALLDVLSLIQEGWRHERPLLLHSGYRTPRTNASIEGAAQASLHLEGQAADIEIRGVAPGELAQAAWSYSRFYNFMGVGVYPRFVHVDVGPRRGWSRT